MIVEMSITFSELENQHITFSRNKQANSELHVPVLNALPNDIEVAGMLSS